MRKFFVRPDMRRDDGLSMPELTVTMLVMSVVLAGLATLFIGSLNTAVGTQARLEEVSDARIAVSSMGRTLRTAILPSQLYDSASTAIGGVHPGRATGDLLLRQRRQRRQRRRARPGCATGSTAPA